MATGDGGNELRCPRADVARLAGEIARAVCDRHGLSSIKLSAGALLSLELRPWTRRALEQTVDAAIARARDDGAELVERGHLYPTNFHEATRGFQTKLLRDALARQKWNVKATARSLGLARSRLYFLLEELEITRPEK